MADSQTHPCPQCGSTDVKLANSRDVYRAFAPAGSQRIAVANTYDCPCGTEFVVSVKNDAGNPGHKLDR